MGEHRLTWLDVFASAPFQGNPLAVVHDADGLSDELMLAFARETGLSETTFVQSPAGDRADYRNRIFDPRQELDFAGHPSLGTAIAVARARREAEAHYVQQTPAGLQPLHVSLHEDGRHGRASMLLEPARYGPELDSAEVLATVGLASTDAHPSLPCQVVGAGVPQVLAPVVSPEVVSRARPDFAAVIALLDSHDAVVLYLVHPEGERVHARSFAHSVEMGEDPATGSAAGPLMAYLNLRAGAERLEIDQGAEIGRPSRLSCSMDDDRVRVAGDAIVVFEGTARL